MLTTIFLFVLIDLLEEYLIWLPQAAHKEVKLIWPPS